MLDSYMVIKNKVIEIFELNGFYLPITVKKEDDFNIMEYEISSLEFISIIIQFEEEFRIRIPDEVLTIELFQSFNALVEFLYDLSEGDREVLLEDMN